MHPPPERCAAAIRAGEARLQAAAERGHPNLDRYQAQSALIRKAWQIVLCTCRETQQKVELSRGVAAGGRAAKGNL